MRILLTGLSPFLGMLLGVFLIPPLADVYGMPIAAVSGFVIIALAILGIHMLCEIPMMMRSVRDR